MKNNRTVLPPEKDEYARFYGNYVELVRNEIILDFLQNQKIRFGKFIESLSPDQLKYCYAPEKWSVAEVIGHITDAERVFNYRALSFARGESSNLHGFEENDYVR
jgi:hypothetical protein